MCINRSVGHSQKFPNTGLTDLNAHVTLFLPGRKQSKQKFLQTLVCLQAYGHSSGRSVLHYCKRRGTSLHLLEQRTGLLYFARD